MFAVSLLKKDQRSLIKTSIIVCVFFISRLNATGFTFTENTFILGIYLTKLTSC